MDEIIFALRERIVGLNTGKWNYMGSLVKRFRNQISSMIDSRHQIKADALFLKRFNQYIVYTAHKRGIHAIGGASNFVPRLNQPKATQLAKQQVIAEKFEEANLGFDGAWVVHPLLVETAQKCFTLEIRSAYNQKHKLADFHSFQQAIGGSCSDFCSLFPFENTKVGEEYDLKV